MTRLALSPDALATAALGAGAVALCALAAQLLCAAARSENTFGCAGLCAAAHVSPAASCRPEHARWVNISEINDAVIGVAYHPEYYVSLTHPRGFVFIESRTLIDSSYFPGESAIASLIRELAPAQASTLARSLVDSNARIDPVSLTQRNFAEQVMLDSAQAEQYLTARTLAEVPLAVTSVLPAVTPGETVPGVLALSRPGLNASHSLAIVVAVLRSPQSLARDHVERASLVLAERSGLSWRVVREWPLTAR